MKTLTTVPCRHQIVGAKKAKEKRVPEKGKTPHYILNKFPDFPNLSNIHTLTAGFCNTH